MTKQQFKTEELPKIKKFLREEKKKLSFMRGQQQLAIMKLTSINLVSQLEKRAHKN